MRYKVNPPVPQYDYWRVEDSESPTYYDFPVIEIHASVPGAGKLAYDLADKLNRESS